MFFKGGCSSQGITSIYPSRSSDLLGKFSRFHDGAVDQEFGTRFLRRFVKKGHGGQIEDFSKYILEFDQRQSDGFSDRFHLRYLDAEFNMCITHGESLVALLGFEIWDMKMTIQQIQGIRAKASLLSPFRWEKALVTYAVDWARNNDIDEVILVSAKNNSHILAEPPIPERYRLRYDVTARRCGFRKDPESGNYILNLDHGAGYAPFQRTSSILPSSR